MNNQEAAKKINEIKWKDSQGFSSVDFFNEMQLVSQNSVIVPRQIKVWGWFAITIFILFSIILLYVPWAQTVIVRGKLSAYSAMERPQEVHAQINGSLHRWNVQEGDSVKKGDLVLKLEDVNPKFMAPDLIKKLDKSRKSLKQNRQAVLDRAKIFDIRINEMTSLVEAAESTATAKVLEAKQKTLYAEQKLTSAKIAKETADLNLQRSKVLQAEGLVSRRELELAIQTSVQADANLKGSEAEIKKAQKARAALEYNRDKINAELVQKLLDTKSKKVAAIGEAAKASKELADIELTRSNALQRRIASKILAPVDGVVVRLTTIGLGEIVKPGDLLFTIVPSKSSPALEMWANAIDAPLLKAGRPVRILFQGVPAIPLAAWPELMAGTYDGRIQVVDQSASAGGKFRFWVEPETNRREWPPQSQVRQGTQVMGWVILNRVPLWYELWRRFNLFPPDYNSRKITLKNVFLPKAGRPSK
ncbi:MAG: HlyD family efflux transporter periplasmic adaptor subunit [Nitrospinae bacterium]|nr:HlyD family efflux transporter periplasmic adaptor subunit [Nitrospinota bacterium]